MAETGRAVGLKLLFWNPELEDYDDTGVVRDDEAILASGDNCTFIGYTTHFTTFTVGALSISLNVIDPTKVPALPLHSRAAESGV